MSPETSPAASSVVPRDLVLVHGLWYGSAFLWRLRSRLRSAGYRVHSFSHAATRVPPERTVARLREFCRDRAPGGAHLVGHSLGGLLILDMLQAQHESQDRWQPGRVVLLGTPINGSAVARQAQDWPGAEILLGHASGPLTRGRSVLPAGIQTGMLAGNLPLGLGRITGALAEPSDGTVAVAETRDPGLSDHLVLPVTHTGMLYAAELARQTVEFLRTGHFDHVRQERQDQVHQERQSQGF